MAVTGISAVPSTPWRSDPSVITGNATGVINVGDWLHFTGQNVMATNSGHTAHWKISGAGIALEGSPVYDQRGRTAANTGMLIGREGMYRVSGVQSGDVALGLLAYPVTTGSGVASPTGLTGLGATWTALAPVAISSNPTGQIASPVAIIVGINNPGQTAQLDIVLNLNHTIGYYG